MTFPRGRRNFARIVDEHYVTLYRFAYRLSGSAAEAEDLTQETFCQAQEKLHQLRDVNKVRPWLFTILRNLWLRRLRDRKATNTVSIDWVGDMPERAGDPEPEITSEQLQQALNQIPEVYRVPIVLYYFGEFSYREIAEHLDLPIGTVMSRLARGKAQLRQRLFPELGEEAMTENSHRRAGNGL